MRPAPWTGYSGGAERLTEVLAVFSAIVAGISLILALRSSIGADRSARAAEKSANAAEESVEVARTAADAAVRSAEAAETGNILARDALQIQQSSAERDEADRARLQQTKLVIEGWSGQGGLVVTNQGPGAASNVLVVLNWPPRHSEFAGMRAEMRELLKMGPVNGWPRDFVTEAEPPPKGEYADVALVRWTNADGSIDDTGWVQAPNIAL